MLAVISVAAATAIHTVLSFLYSVFRKVGLKINVFSYFTTSYAFKLVPENYMN